MTLQIPPLSTSEGSVVAGRTFAIYPTLSNSCISSSLNILSTSSRISSRLSSLPMPVFSAARVSNAVCSVRRKVTEKR